MITGIGKATGKFIGKAAVKDVTKFINPHEGTSVIEKALVVANELSALAQGETLPQEGPLEDNRNEDLLEAQLRLEFAFAERLSHVLAYQDITQQQTIIPMLEADNVVRHYQIHKIESDHGGIVGNILIPYSNPELRRVYVNFRGTDPGILATLHLDLEHNAGEESFHRHYGKILAQINTLIGKVSDSEDKPVELVISGYSLGGALGQYCFNMMMLLSALKLRTNLKIEEIDDFTQDLITDTEKQLNAYLLSQYKIEPLKVSFEDFEHLAKIRTFHINGWGASGVSTAVEDCSNQLANILLANGKNIIGRFGENILDPVAKTGEAKILSDCGGDLAHMRVKDENLDVKRSFISGCISGVTESVIIGGPFGLLIGGITMLTKGLSPLKSAHTSLNFGSMGEKLAGKKYTIFLNKKPCDSTKATNAVPDHQALTVLQHPVLLKAKNALRQVGDAGASAKQTAWNGLVKGVTSLYGSSKKENDDTVKSSKEEEAVKSEKKITL